jgi:hypothetical protein
MTIPAPTPTPAPNPAYLLISEMEVKDWITITIALYAAILSTIIFVRDYIRSKNHLKITFSINKHSNRNRIIITNSGVSPLTIVDFVIGIPHIYKDDSGNEYWDTVNLLLPVEDFKTPKFLKEGETIVSDGLSDYTSAMIFCLEKKKKLKLVVVDSKGRVYKKYKLKYEKFIAYC